MCTLNVKLYPDRTCTTSPSRGAAFTEPPPIREFPQVENVDVNVDIRVSHPVGPSTPWIKIISESEQIIQH